MVLLTGHDRNFRCCFSMHVRTGTIILGTVQIILHLFAIGVLVVFTMRPDLFHMNTNGSVTLVERGHNRHPFSTFLFLIPGVSDLHESFSLPPRTPNDKAGLDLAANPLSNEPEDSQRKYNRNFIIDDTFSSPLSPSTDIIKPNENPRRVPATSQHRKRYHPYFTFCVSLFSLAFCCFLVHGAVTHQPAQLLPYFFLQVFDFIINLLTVVGYVSSSADVRLHMHYKDNQSYVTSLGFTIMSLSILCLALAFKAYCLGMVWDCYKYLMLTSHPSGRNGHNLILTGRSGLLPTVWSLFGVHRLRSMSAMMRSGSSNINDDGLPSVDSNGRQTTPVYDQANDLPKYEEALKIPANAYAPPPYFCPPASEQAKSDNTDNATLHNHNGSS